MQKIMKKSKNAMKKTFLSMPNAQDQSYTLNLVLKKLTGFKNYGKKIIEKLASPFEPSKKFVRAFIIKARSSLSLARTQL